MAWTVEKIDRNAVAGVWAAVPEGYEPGEIYPTVSDACRVYGYRDLEHKLRSSGGARSASASRGTAH